MKKVNFFLIIVLMTAILTSCGAEDESGTLSNFKHIRSSQNAKLDVEGENEITTEFSDAQEAAEAYSAMMQNYAKALSEGNEEVAKCYMKSIESIESYVHQNFSNQKELIESISEMNNKVLEMQQEYMDGTFEAYDEMLNNFGDLPGISEAQKGMNEAQNEMNDATNDAQKQMDDAMKQYDGQY